MKDKRHKKKLTQPIKEGKETEEEGRKTEANGKDDHTPYL